MERFLKESEQSRSLREKFRLCLLALGRSPDSHIYDLDETFLAGNRSPEASLFIRKIKDFYENLGNAERRFFVKECLEKDRHYKFWYLGEYQKLSYDSAFLQMQEKIKELMA